MTTSTLTLLELQSAIIREPLVVTADATVMEAIALMSSGRSQCDAENHSDNHRQQFQQEARSSCVLVLEDEKLIGVVTERDVVRLSAQQQDLDRLLVREVMAHPVVTLRESDLTDLFLAVNLLQQYHIRHLPLLDEQDLLVGMVTHESLRQISRPIDLMRLRLVAEVMTPDVICAAPDRSMLAIAQLMANHRVSSVMIVQAQPLQIPVGIVTERDIVQFQALGLNLETCIAETVMSTPIFAVTPNDSLWLVQQMMEQRFIHRLAVTGEEGELLGIVTQSSLLQALNPLELYNLAEILEAKVAKLEAEKIALLESRTIELEQQVEVRTIALRTKAEQEKLVADIASQIRSSLSLQTILDTAVAAVRKLLGCDRANISQFINTLSTDISTESLVVVAESTDSLHSLRGMDIADHCFKGDIREIYRQGQIRIVPDIYTTPMHECHREMLIRLHTRSKIVVPLVCEDQLWGLLNVCESQRPRDWQPEEVELLQMLSVHLAIAIQQATIHQKLQAQVIELQKSESRLRESEHRYVTLTAAAPVGIFRTDVVGNSIYSNKLCDEMLGLPLGATNNNGWQHALHPEDREYVIAETIRTRQQNLPFHLEYRILRPDGTVIWVLGQAIAERNAQGQIVGYVGTITDISARKQVEIDLIQSEAKSRAILTAIPDLMFRMGADGNHRGFILPNNKINVLAADFDPKGLAIVDILPLEIANRHLHNLELTLRTGELQVYQQQIQAGDRLQDEEVRVIKVSEDEALFIVRDITERQTALRELKKAEKDLRYTEKLFQEAQRLAQIGNWVMNLVDDSLYWSDEVFRIFEIDSQTFGATYEAFLNAIHPDDRDMVDRSYTQSLRDRTPYNIIHRLLMTDGRIKYVQERGDASYNTDGSPTLSQGTVQDITDLKQTERALQQLNQNLETEVAQRTADLQASETTNRTTLDAIPDLLLRLKRDGSCLSYIKSEIKGENFLPITPPELLQRQLQMIEQAIATRELQVYEHQFYKQDQLVHEEVRILAIDDQEVLAIIRDISDRKQVENALRESQALFQTVLDAFPLSVFWKDRKSVLLGCNQLFAMTCGMKSPLEAIGKNVFEFSYTNDEALGYLADDQQVMESGLAKLNIEELITLASGEQQWLQTNKVPLRDSEGDVIGVMGTFQDISDRKQAELALAQKEQQFQELANASPSVIYSIVQPLNGAPYFEYLSPASEKIHELTVAEAYQNSAIIFEQMHPDDLQGYGDAIKQSLKTLQPFSHEWRIITNSGTKWLRGNSLPSQRKNGDIVWHGVVTEISDRKQAEITLQSSEERFRRIFDSSVVGMIFVDFQGHIIDANDRFLEMVGYTREDFQSGAINWLAMTPPEYLEKDYACMEILLEHRQIDPWEKEYYRKDGSRVSILIGAALLQEENTEAICVILDISDRKQSEAKLQLANEELMRVTRLKDEFLANMSHELRTPLNSILGMNEGLQEGVFGSINERQLKALHTIENSSTHLLALINDILDVAKIESGQVTLELTATQLDSLCKSSLAFIKQQALTKRIQLIHRIPKYLPEIMLDERRIRQVLINLLNNAVKFTLEGGTITLEVSQVQLESSTTNLTPLNYLKIAVIDTGIGISAENMQKLFQPFIQIDSALNRQYTGTGLGLALVKRLVEIHGGNVELTSEVGVGSCFAINLPISIGSPSIEEQPEHDLSGQPQIGQSQTEELISPLILLAEDNEANIATFTSYLEAKGYRIVLATDGQQAIDLAKAEHPDLILMDIQMPVIDGMEAIKQIRLDRNLVNIPIIALTALAMAGDREKCLEVGANEYLPKPVKLKVLAMTIQQLLS